ncbi:MAG: hypothetical protein R3A45_13440 [Bdellovibrionota bacterium]
MMTKDEAPLGLFGLSITISLVIHLLVFWVSSWHFNHSKAIVEPSLHEKPVQWVNLQEQFQNSKIVDIENPKNVTEKRSHPNICLTKTEMRLKTRLLPLRIHFQAARLNNTTFFDTGFKPLGRKADQHFIENRCHAHRFIQSQQLLT